MKSSEYRESGSLWIHAAHAILITIVIFCFASHLFGQSREGGEIRGTVTDSSGAVVPDAKVVIKNDLTGTSHNFVTDKEGVYDDNFVLNGTYTVTVTKDGFKQYVKSGITVTQDLIGVNAVLQPGSVHETIEVQAETNAVETESTEIHTTLTGDDLHDIPNMQRNILSATSVVPGATGSGEGTSFTGTAALQSNWQIDGGIATYATSQNTNSLFPPIDSVAEFKVTTSNFGAEYGNGLSVINAVGKSGTNQWHGSLFEWYQSGDFSGTNYFSRSKPNPGGVWNQFGGTVGGPIKRNKAFFFFTLQQTRAGGKYAAYETVPTLAMQGGDLSALCTLQGGSIPTSGPNAGLCINQTNTGYAVGAFLEAGQLYDPATYNPATGARQPLPYNQILSSRMDPVAAAINAYFPAPNVPGKTEVPGLNNLFYTASQAPNIMAYYSGKLDYDVTSSNRLSLSTSDTPQKFASNMPICPYNCDTGGMTFQSSTQLTDNWTITPHLANQARFTFAVYPYYWTADTYGKGYPAKLGILNPGDDIFPSIGINSPMWEGATAPGSNGQGNYFEHELDYSPSDLATWVTGKHIVEFGGEFDRWYNGGPWTVGEEGSFSFAPDMTDNPADIGKTDANGNPLTIGDGYASFLLGYTSGWSMWVPKYSTAVASGLHLFVSDAYKIRPNLTLTLGARYIHQVGWSEEHNMIANFDPTLINPATNTPGAMLFAPNDGFTHFTNPMNFLMPRFGFAWEPIKDTSIRGGYGLYNYMLGNTNYGSQGYGIYGLFGTLTDSASNGVAPVFGLSQPAPVPGYTPPVGPPTVASYTVTAANETPASFNGNGVNYYVPNMHIGYTEQFQVDVEHHFAGDILATVAYVGNRGHHLPSGLWGHDMNQVPASLLPLASVPGVNIQQYRPYPNFLTINRDDDSDWSHYDSLQATVKKHLSHGVSVQANYTWAHAMDTGTPSGAWGYQGTGWQNAYNLRAEYGSSANDIRQVFHGWVTYDLPVGKGKQFLTRPGWVDAIVGGWSTTLVANAQSGSPFTPVWAGSTTTNAGSGTLRPDRIGSGVLPKSKRSLSEWFDITAFVQPPNGYWGNSGRNILYGPGYQDWDASLRKNFAIPWLGEKGRLQFQAQASNVFNHVNFGGPNANMGTTFTPAAGNNFASGPGTINSEAGAPRNMQVGATLYF